jgi:hypothetical protein
MIPKLPMHHAEGNKRKQEGPKLQEVGSRPKNAKVKVKTMPQPRGTAAGEEPRGSRTAAGSSMPHPGQVAPHWGPVWEKWWLQRGKVFHERQVDKYFEMVEEANEQKLALAGCIENQQKEVYKHQAKLREAQHELEIQKGTLDLLRDQYEKFKKDHTFNIQQMRFWQEQLECSQSGDEEDHEQKESDGEEADPRY